MSILTDMDQNDRLDILERKIKRLEKRMNGGSKMSSIIKNLVGMDCIIEAEDIYDEKCRVLECDDEWIKVLVFGKKSDKTIIIPIDTIEKITLE